jgi:hypothetical protein
MAALMAMYTSNLPVLPPVSSPGIGFDNIRPELDVIRRAILTP